MKKPSITITQARGAPKGWVFVVTARSTRHRLVHLRLTGADGTDANRATCGARPVYVTAYVTAEDRLCRTCGRLADVVIP